MKLIQTNFTEAQVGDNKLQELQLLKLKAETNKILVEAKITKIKTKTHRYLSVFLAGLALMLSLGDFLD